MKGDKKIVQTASSLLMIVALLWLTVSTPFIYSAQQQAEKAMIQESPGDETEEAPLTNTTEEKSESSPTTLSEYLNELLHVDRPFTLVAKLFKCHPSDVYFEFHPELISPPPEA